MSKSFESGSSFPNPSDSNPSLGSPSSGMPPSILPTVGLMAQPIDIGAAGSTGPKRSNRGSSYGGHGSVEVLFTASSLGPLMANDRMNISSPPVLPLSSAGMQQSGSAPMKKKDRKAASLVSGSIIIIFDSDD